MKQLVAHWPQWSGSLLRSKQPATGLGLGLGPAGQHAGVVKPLVEQSFPHAPQFERADFVRSAHLLPQHAGTTYLPLAAQSVSAPKRSQPPQL